MGVGSFFMLLAPWIQSKLVSFKGDKNYFKFWNNSQINLCHCQHEKDLLDYQGAEIHVLMIDELTQWPKDFYQYLRGQVRIGGLQVPPELKDLFPRIIAGANPGGIGHNWVRAAFIDLLQPYEMKQMEKKEGGLIRQYIPAKLEDNPTILENDPGYENRLEGMGTPAMVKAMRWGIWDIVAGGAIDDLWDPEKHVIPAFEIPPTWRVRRSLDWGDSKPYSVGWWAEADGSEVLINDRPRFFYPKSKIRVAEDYGWNGNPNEGCRRLPAEVGRRIKEIEKNLSFKNQIRPGPADSSIFNSDRPIADDMAKVGVRWTMSDKRPGSRVAGLKQLRTMLSAGLKSPMEEPGIFIFDTCRHFIRTVPVLPRDPKNMDDVETLAEDH